MAEFAQLQAPQREILKHSWMQIKIKKLWWGVSRKLWKTKDPLRYMCAVAELVIRTWCDEQTHNAGDTVVTAHNAAALTKGFSALMHNLTTDKEFRNISILTMGQEMTVAEFLLDGDVYVNACAHMNFHAVTIWLLGRFALANPKELPENSAVFNHNTVVSMAPTWTKYLESILTARLKSPG